MAATDVPYFTGSDSYGVLSSDANSISGIDYAPTIPSVVDNTNLALLDLPGQLDSIPGGDVTAGAFPGGAADPSGVNSLYLHPAVNPTPTGGYMNVLASIAASAAGGFSTYAKGSPSVATPRPLLPGTSMTKTALTGGTNWLVIGVVVAVGIGVIAWLAKAA